MASDDESRSSKDKSPADADEDELEKHKSRDTWCGEPLEKRFDTVSQAQLFFSDGVILLHWC
jgi:hypothetical protein